MSEKRSPRGRTRARFLFGNIGLPDKRRRNPVADHIHTVQVWVFPALQETFQALNLARRAGKQHLALGLQGLLGLAICIANRALQVFAAAERRQIFRRFHRNMPDTVLVVCHSCAEHHAALGQDIFRQQREHAAARTLAADVIVLIDRRIGGGRFILRFPRALQDWANFLTQIAVDASRFIDLRIEETFGIRLHRDAMLRADLRTGMAAAAVLFFYDVFLFCHGHPLIYKLLFELMVN